MGCNKISNENISGIVSEQASEGAGLNVSGPGKGGKGKGREGGLYRR